MMCRTPLDAMICSDIPPDPLDPLTAFQHLYQQTQTQGGRHSNKKKIQTDPSPSPTNHPDPSLSSSKGKLVDHEESKMYVPRLYLKETLLRLMCFRCPTCGKVVESSAPPNRSSHSSSSFLTLHRFLTRQFLCCR